MLKRIVRRKTWLVIFGLAALLALMLVGSGALAATKCKSISGKFTLQPVTGPTCISSVDLCAVGTYSGGLKGNSQFTGTSLIPTVDTPTTGVVMVTGDNAIHTDSGDVLTKDAIALKTTGAGEFAEVDVIVGGTGAWLGVTGQVSAAGVFTASGGEGAYNGEVCLP